MNKGLISLLGFLLFAVGLIGLILSLVGLRLSMLSWLEQSPVLALIVKLGLIVIGLIMMYIVRLEHDD